MFKITECDPTMAGSKSEYDAACLAIAFGDGERLRKIAIYGWTLVRRIKNEVYPFLKGKENQICNWVMS